MTLVIENYTRRPFPVEVVEVTEENLAEAARWCGGEIHTSTKTVRDDNNVEIEKIKVPYIKVDVYKPLNLRHTKAFVGDRILKSDSGFKVYNAKAFAGGFEKDEVQKSESGATLSLDAAAVQAAAQEQETRTDDGFPEPTELYSFKDSLGQRGLDVPTQDAIVALAEEYFEAGMRREDAQALATHEILEGKD